MGDSDEETQILGVDKVLLIRQKLSSSASLNDGAMAKCCNEEHFSESDCDITDTFSDVRKFDLPIIDQTATSYKMVDLNSWQQQPPVIGHLTDLDIEQCRVRPLKLDCACHNQSLVTEASAQVESFAQRDGMISQKIKSRKFLKFNTKMQF